MLTVKSWIVFLLVFVVAFPAAETLAAEPIEEKVDGVALVSVPPKPGEKFDVSLMGQTEGLAKLKQAYGLIAEKSPFSMAQIARLKEAGQVVIFYDPNYPKRTFDKIVAASYFPNFFDPESTDPQKRVFLTVVGRHGIKWPVKELAAVLVHELVGHGIQRLEGRILSSRQLDTECEAWLYEELAYQRLGMDKKSREMIQFRQEMERIHCSDFKIYMRKAMPKRLALWDVLNPDVPRLLGYFKKYQEGRKAEPKDAAPTPAKQQ